MSLFTSLHTRLKSRLDRPTCPGGSNLLYLLHGILDKAGRGADTKLMS